MKNYLLVLNEQSKWLDKMINWLQLQDMHLKIWNLFLMFLEGFFFTAGAFLFWCFLNSYFKWLNNKANDNNTPDYKNIKINTSHYEILKEYVEQYKSILIDGPQGSGKTSLSKKLIFDKKKDSKYEIVELKGWDYDEQMKPLVVFLYKLLSLKSIDKKSKKRIQKAIRYANDKKFIYETGIDFVAFLKTTLRDIKICKDIKILFVVDELDRTEPRFVSELIESLTLYLGIEEQLDGTFDYKNTSNNNQYFLFANPNIKILYIFDKEKIEYNLPKYWGFKLNPDNNKVMQDEKIWKKHIWQVIQLTEDLNFEQILDQLDFERNKIWPHHLEKYTVSSRDLAILKEGLSKQNKKILSQFHYIEKCYLVFNILRIPNFAPDINIASILDANKDFFTKNKNGTFLQDIKNVIYKINELRNVDYDFSKIDHFSKIEIMKFKILNKRDRIILEIFEEKMTKLYSRWLNQIEMNISNIIKGKETMNNIDIRSSYITGINFISNLDEKNINHYVSIKNIIEEYLPQIINEHETKKMNINDLLIQCIDKSNVDLQEKIKLKKLIQNFKLVKKQKKF